MSIVLLSQADIDRLHAIRPWCCVCDRPVSFIDWRRELRSPALTFRVYCHGETESMQIGIPLLNALTHGGKAFRHARRIKDENPGTPGRSAGRRDPDDARGAPSGQ